MSGKLKVPKVAGKRKGKASQRGKKRKFALATTAQLAAGETVKVKVKLNRKARRATRKALRAGKRAKAKLRVVATDAVGNASPEQRAKTTLRKRRK